MRAPLAIAVVLSVSASPALAQLDPSTAALAAQYAATAQTCMQRAALVGVRAGQLGRVGLVQNLTARCGNDWMQFLLAHGETARQAQGELTAMAGRVVDDALKPPAKPHKK